MSCHYQLKIQYVGTRYMGWQFQEHGPTIQGELNAALMTLAKSDLIRTIGSGRTDAGVHALGQIVKATLPFSIPCQGLLRGLNALLPTDIRIISCEESNADFHPTFQATHKEYNYLISDLPLSPFLAPFVHFYNYKLDLSLIQTLCDQLIGTYDFKNFQCVGTDVQNTIRTINMCRIEQVRQHTLWPGIDIPQIYVFRIDGNGFLKQMVRMIVGAILEINRGRGSVQDLHQSLLLQKRGRLGPVAPAHGLFLKEVFYH